MSKIPGNQLLNLIYNAKNLANIGSDSFTVQQIEDCAVVPVAKQEVLYTADFGPLVGKDYFIAGKIAALNAISDIYAMGGIPRYALVLLTLDNSLGTQEKEQILAGLYHACQEEKIVVVGGHTIYGKETLAGLSVIGEAGGNDILYKKTCHVGDAILISKPLGTGLALRGYYHGILNEDQYQKAIDVLQKSNIVDKLILNSMYTHAMTDVTGFGFIGHLTEMLGNNKGARIYLDQVPYLESINDLCVNVMLNNYISNNYDYASEHHRIKSELNSIKKLALFDPQTNGPIMICIDKKFVSDVERLGYYFVGEVIETNEIALIGD